jgi:hypothetical protein
VTRARQKAEESGMRILLGMEMLNGMVTAMGDKGISPGEAVSALLIEACVGAQALRLSLPQLHGLLAQSFQIAANSAAANDLAELLKKGPSR